MPRWECFEKGWDLEEPPADDPNAASMIKFMLTGLLTSKFNQTLRILRSKANKPSPLFIKPIFGCEAVSFLDDCIEKGTKQVRYHLSCLLKMTGYA